MSQSKANPRDDKGRFQSPLVITGQGDNRRTIGEPKEGEDFKTEATPLWLAIVVFYGWLCILGALYEAITTRR